MAIVFNTYQRQFFLGAGVVDLKITYATDEYQYLTLDFEVINIAELSHGYEDDDQLTFYPNVLTITCDDFTKQNFTILKYATQLRPPLTEDNQLVLPHDWTDGSTRDLDKFYGIELKLDGKLLFKGFIDRNKIEYNNREGTLVFDCLDYTALLHQLNYKFDYYQDTGLFHWFSPVEYAYGLFQYIYPDLPNFSNINEIPVTNNVETFSNMVLGYYFRHNWLFYCGNEKYPRSWDMNIDPTGWYNVQFYMPLLKSNSTNLAEDIKGLAYELGCTVGSDVYNKVYCFKRFLTLNEIYASNPVVLNDNENVIEYERFMHLPQIRAVRNITKRSNLVHIEGEGEFPKVANDPKSSAAFTQYQLDIQTTLEPASGQNGTEGKSTFLDTEPGYPGVEIMNGILDPSLDMTSEAYKILTRWYYLNRLRNRDRYEFELWGVDYWMYKIYMYHFPCPVGGDEYVFLRPMTIKKDLVNNKTKMTGIEMVL